MPMEYIGDRPVPAFKPGEAITALDDPEYVAGSFTAGREYVVEQTAGKFVKFYGNDGTLQTAYAARFAPARPN